MATSNWQNISYCCELIYRINPRRVLDVGLGSTARWGSLIHEFADVWHDRIYPNEWQVVLDGVEIYPQNILPLHSHFYNNIYQGDATEVVPKLEHYDLIILGDMVEHMSKKKALALIKICLTKSWFVLINTPVGKLKDWPQGALHDNKFEEHIYIFSTKEILNSKQWKVVSYDLFHDYINRNHGSFLLTEM